MFCNCIWKLLSQNGNPLRAIGTENIFTGWTGFWDVLLSPASTLSFQTGNRTSTQGKGKGRITGWVTLKSLQKLQINTGETECAVDGWYVAVYKEKKTVYNRYCSIRVWACEKVSDKVFLFFCHREPPRIHTQLTFIFLYTYKKII